MRTMQRSEERTYLGRVAPHAAHRRGRSTGRQRSLRALTLSRPRQHTLAAIASGLLVLGLSMVLGFDLDLGNVQLTGPMVEFLMPRR